MLALRGYMRRPFRVGRPAPIKKDMQHRPLDTLPLCKCARVINLNAATRMPTRTTVRPRARHAPGRANDLNVTQCFEGAHAGFGGARIDNEHQWWLLSLALAHWEPIPIESVFALVEGRESCRLVRISARIKC